jgi:hypothetical protein
MGKQAIKQSLVKSIKKLDSTLSWTFIKRIGGLRILQTSYIFFIAIPIAAKFITSIGPELSIPIWEETLRLSLPFSWSLLYFSSFAISVANVVYFFGCPQLIKDYDTLDNFVQEGHNINQVLRHIISYIHNFKKNDDLETVQLILERFHYYACKRQSHLYDNTDELVMCNDLDDVVERFLSKIENRLDHSSSYALENTFYFTRNILGYTKSSLRYLCAILFFVGIILFIIVLLQGFTYVCKTTFG